MFNDSTKVYLKEMIVILIAVFVVSFVIYIYMSNSEESTRPFISKCNSIYGEGNWQVNKLNQYTSYSDEFWLSHPIVDMDVLDLRSDLYSCFKKV